jgi:hypothetical protein
MKIIKISIPKAQRLFGSIPVYYQDVKTQFEWCLLPPYADPPHPEDKRKWQFGVHRKHLNKIIRLFYRA